MLKSPYQTFSCSGYILDKIVGDVQKELAVDPFSWSQLAGNKIGHPVVQLFSNDRFNPTPFAHPIDVVRPGVNRGEQESKEVVVDCRPFTKTSRFNELTVTNHPEMELARRRGVLHAIWVTSDSYLLRNTLNALMPIFSSWVSESIAKRLDMDAISQLKIANIAAWWFWCQCNEKDDLDGNTRNKVLRLISDATRSSFETVEEDLTGIEYFDDITTFCDEAKERLSNPRVKHLDPGALIQLATGVWMGTHAREIMAVAIEYPPYLAAVVYSALHERGMRSAQFTKLVQRFVTRPDVKGFKHSIDQLSTME